MRNDEQPSRRQALAVLGGVVGGAFAVGVGGGALGEAFDGNRRYPGCDPGSPELAVLIDEDLTPGRIRRELIRSWKDDVTLVEMPSKTDLIRTELAALGRTGSCRYDVVNLDVAWTEEIVQSGYFREFADPPSGLLELVRETGRAGDRQYTVPFVTDAALLYYRTDVLGNEPLPSTLAEAIATGERLRKRLGSDMAAYAGQFADYEGLTVNALEAIWSGGGQELDFRAAATQAALDQLVRWVRDSYILAETDEQSSVDAFREGRSIFLRNWPFAFHQLYDAPALRGRLGVVALPWASVLGGHNLGIAQSTTPARYESAAALIRYLTSPGSQDELLMFGGNAPVLETSYRPQDCTRPVSPPAGISAPGCEQLNHFAAELRKSLGKARPRPKAEWYAAYSRVLRSHLYPALAETSELDFERLQQEVDSVVG